jgi:threonine synthase
MIDPYVSGDISTADLAKITKSAFTFDIPLIFLNEKLGVLELFHGPTLAFKDIAARFMARCMEHLLHDEITVLVATSGDTGSAVANGFFGVKDIRVVVLYPSNRVSPIQEKQLTTLGNNISALEVEGSFDDCQRMVKEAFLDENLREQRALSSANSINIARLLPQSVYYAWAWKQVSNADSVVFSVPSGNFGNINAGILAKRMGLPVKKFIAATNANDVFPKYLQSGKIKPQPSKHTLSNAMDVGKPSNLDRILKLYNQDLNALQEELTSWSFSDNETRSSIHNTKDSFNYIIDPHTAIGLLGLDTYHRENGTDYMGIVLGTAHPGKFADVIEPIISEKVSMPKRLKESMSKEKHATMIPNQYSYLKEYLLET